MSRRDRKRHPARQPAFRAVRKRLLIVCEGQVTEPEYLRGFRNWYKNPLVSIEIAKKAGDPSFVVRQAKQLRDDALGEAKRRHDDNLAFDEVWCVFDVDGVPAGRTLPSAMHIRPSRIYDPRLDTQGRLRYHQFMTNQRPSDSLVTSLRDHLSPAGIGVIRVWGSDVVRPSDQIYELKSAALSSGVLRLVLFLALDGKDRFIEVDQPVGAKLAKNALRIDFAAAVRVFGAEYKPPSANAATALYLGM